MDLAWFIAWYRRKEIPYAHLLDQLPASSVYTFLIPRNRGEGYLRPYNGLYETALPERGTFFRFQVYGRVGILLVEVYDCL